MRTDYLDMEYWEKLARKQKVRLPQKQAVLTKAVMERLLKLCGWTFSSYQRWSGFRTLQQFIEANPEWSARAFAGLLLEAS